MAKLLASLHAMNTSQERCHQGVREGEGLKGYGKCGRGSRDEGELRGGVGGAQGVRGLGGAQGVREVWEGLKEGGRKCGRGSRSEGGGVGGAQGVRGGVRGAQRVREEVREGLKE